MRFNERVDDMKRLMTIFMVLVVAVVLCACGAASSAPDPASSSVPATTETATPTLEPTEKHEADGLESELEDKICSALPFQADVSVGLSDVITSVNIYLKSSDPTAFGNRVYDAMSVCDEIFDGERYSLFLIDSNPKTDKSLTFSSFSSISGGIGTFSVVRSGTSEMHECASFDDLAEFFPALNIYISEKEVEEESPEDMAIYNYVMKKLDDEPNRSEEDIFAEIAPNYGMTVEELRQFIFEMMEKIY